MPEEGSGIKYHVEPFSSALSCKPACPSELEWKVKCDENVTIPAFEPGVLPAQSPWLCLNYGNHICCSKSWPEAAVATAAAIVTIGHAHACFLRQTL